MGLDFSWLRHQTEYAEGIKHARSSFVLGNVVRYLKAERRAALERMARPCSSAAISPPAPVGVLKPDAEAERGQAKSMMIWAPAQLPA
jgi:hypothetical protein